MKVIILFSGRHKISRRINTLCLLCMRRKSEENTQHWLPRWVQSVHRKGDYVILWKLWQFIEANINFCGTFNFDFYVQQVLSAPQISFIIIIFVIYFFNSASSSSSIRWYGQIRYQKWFFLFLSFLVFAKLIRHDAHNHLKMSECNQNYQITCDVVFVTKCISLGYRAVNISNIQ